MSWLKENWFRVSLLVLGGLYLITVFYGLYLDTKKHSLDVLVEIRQCIKSFDGKNAEQCANLAKQQLLFSDYFYRKEGRGFE